MSPSLRAHQVDGVRFDRRPVTRGCGRVRWELGGRHAPARTAALFGSVFGHDHGRVRDIEHLPDRGPDHVKVRQGPVTGPAPHRPMRDHLVRIGDLRQCEPGRARLFALPAAHRPARRTVGVLRPVQQLLALGLPRRHHRNKLTLQPDDPSPRVHSTCLQALARTVVDDRAFRAITPDWLPNITSILAARAPDNVVVGVTIDEPPTPVDGACSPASPTAWSEDIVSTIETLCAQLAR